MGTDEYDVDNYMLVMTILMTIVVLFIPGLWIMGMGAGCHRERMRHLFGIINSSSSFDHHHHEVMTMIIAFIIIIFHCRILCQNSDA